MNSIIMVVGAVIAILIVFIIFAQDEIEDEEETNQKTKAEANSTSKSENDEANLNLETKTATEQHTVAHSETSNNIPGKKEEVYEDVNPEEDLHFRLELAETLPAVSQIKLENAVALVLQLRFQESVFESESIFLDFLNHFESVLHLKELPFSFSVYPLNQASHLLLFGFDEERDDAIFESLVTAIELIARFKKMIEGDKDLLQIKARVAIGISYGQIARIFRGPVGTPSHAGKPVFLAEALAESAGDFQIYVDEEVYKLGMPLFDFREWKPMRLRQSMPPIAFFELVGWNKKEEIFAFVSHSEAFARRAVAIAYRYLDFDDISPLLNLVYDQDEKVSLDALKTIAEIGDERALGILKKILPESKNAALRTAVIEAMGKVGKEEIIPALLASTRDTSWQVRFAAVKSLHRIAGSEAIKHIENLVKDEDGAVRALVHQILYQHYNRESDLNALKDLLGDLSVRARKAAIEGLIAIGKKETLMAVAKVFPNQETELKKHILWLLEKVESSFVYQCFLTIFQICSDKDKTDVVSALRRSRLITKS